MPRLPVITNVVPAIVTPFTEDYAIDEGALESLTDKILESPEVGAVFCVGHAGEVSSLDRKERQQVTRRVVAAADGRVPVIAGVYTDSVTEAINHARDAREAGAAAVTVFVPPIFADGAMLTTEFPVTWHKRIIQEAETPVILFQLSRQGDTGYSYEALAEMCEMPEVVGVKEGSGTMRDYEANYRLLSTLPEPVPVLSTQNSNMLASLAVGADGILSGSGSFLAAEHSLLWKAMQEDDLKTAREISDRLYPLVRAIYAAPRMHMNTRIKEASQLLGMIPSGTVRPPLLPLPEEERANIREALQLAGML